MPFLPLAPGKCRVALLLGNPELGKNERVVERHLTEEVVPARSPAMPCGHVDPEQERVRVRSEEHTSELQSRLHLVCRLLLEKKKKHKSSIRLSTSQTDNEHS